LPGSNVVIVESPAKAKTINKYLGDDYTVIASFGHVRDLPARDGSVRPDDDFAMEWELGERSKRHIDEIAKAVKTADRIYLATDPDREGEAIAWHLSELLREKRLSDNRDVQRVTFNEITKSAVQTAMANPRAVSQELVDPIWPAARWIIWWDSPCRRCCGASCPVPNPPAACSRWRCA